VNLGIKVAESASRVSRVSELDLGAAWQEVQHLMPICIAVESGFGFHRANEEQAGSDRPVCSGNVATGPGSQERRHHRPT
jgi:hypothetical protein